MLRPSGCAFDLARSPLTQEAKFAHFEAQSPHSGVENLALPSGREVGFFKDGFCQSSNPSLKKPHLAATWKRQVFGPTVR